MMDLLRIKVGQILLVTYRQLIFYLPETSDSISLNNFMLQLHKERHLSNCTYSTNIGLSGVGFL
jgi:hypothetical protein